MKTRAMLPALFAVMATVIAVFVFWVSRSDHDMKLLALGAAISQVSALMATASTMLTGKDLTHPADDLADLPKGSAITTTTVAQTPPVQPQVIGGS